MFTTLQVMQVQETHDLASSRLQAAYRPASSTTANTWKYLPIHWLEHCQRVDSHFSGFQVEFESAIAIHPSNPRFQLSDLPIALMSSGQGKSLTVTLGEAITAIEVWLLGSEAITVSALNDNGDRTETVRTQDVSNDETAVQLSAQGVTVETRSASTIRIDSRSPFLLTRFAIQQT